MVNETKPAQAVVFSYSEADTFMTESNKMRESIVASIKSVKRRTSWRPSEKAMAIAALETRLEVVNIVRERIGTAFNLGGY